MTKQEQRLKNAFASSIAASMSTRCSARNLSPEELRKEFDGIDTDHSGTVSKEEFKNFITSTDVATLDPHDFEVLFSTIDIDGNKEIDFSEFCAFFALIRSDVEKAMREGAVPSTDA
jgi:Ca2+-binding EF-hand superfamily protein